MNLWLFLTIAVIVWGIVEIVQSRVKERKNKILEIDAYSRKKVEEKVELLERRVANLETVIAEEGSQNTYIENEDSSQFDAKSDSGIYSGRLSNKLRD